MSNPRHAISARDSHIWTLRAGLVVLTLITLGLIALLYARQNAFTVHVPPDLSRGAQLKPGELLAPNAYAFAHNIWRELNEWRVSGKNDYPAAIKTYSCYVTPSFGRWLTHNFEEKQKAGELDRTRSLATLQPFNLEMVKPMGDNGYAVAIAFRLYEQVSGQEVKDTGIVYPLRVVPDNRSCNQMGMALDGFYDQPARIETEEDKKNAKP